MGLKLICKPFIYMPDVYKHFDLSWKKFIIIQVRSPYTSEPQAFIKPYEYFIPLLIIGKPQRTGIYLWLSHIIHDRSRSRAHTSSLLWHPFTDSMYQIKGMSSNNLNQSRSPFSIFDRLTLPAAALTMRGSFMKEEHMLCF